MASVLTRETTAILGRARSWPADAASLLRPALSGESDRWFLWIPVLLGTGIAVFFGLPAAPAGGTMLAVGLVAMAAAAIAWTSRARRPLVALAAGALAILLAGAVIAHLRLARVEAPIVARAGTFTVTGRVVEIAPRLQGHRLLLDRLEIAELAPDARPLRVRITVRKGAEELEPGDRVRVRARLAPPPGPALPGGFDYARQAWFEGLGGMGWALGPIERLEGEDGDWRTFVAELRAAVAARLMAHAQGASGAVSAALIAGLRAGIDGRVWSDFQRSGLAHLLSISGLHMALVAGTIYLAARYSLALIVPLAVRVPVRKIAAVVALVAAAGYLLLAGDTAPTIRSFLMVAVGLLAITIDRSPISMRLLAWAAIVMLLARPEAVLGASFQLSFAAVLALVAVYETGRLTPAPADGERSVAARGGLYLRGVALTTLVAGLATTPLSAYHFQNMATFGILANLVAVPITSFWVMPAGLLALALMPFGLEGPAVVLMATGVDLVLATARIVAALPGAAVAVPLLPMSTLALFWVAAVWLALWRRAWRLWGLVPLALSIAIGVASRPPDLVVTPWLEMIGAGPSAGESGLLVITRDSDSITLEGWERGLGSEAVKLKPDQPFQREGFACDREGCVLRRGERSVGLARSVGAVLEDCPQVDLVIARVGPERCPVEGRLIGPWALARSGGIALWLDRTGPTIRTIAEARGDWPWSRPAPEGANRTARAPR